MEILFLCINTSELYLQFLRRVKDNIVRIKPSWKISIENLKSNDTFLLQTILNDEEYDQVVVFVEFDVFAQDTIGSTDRYSSILKVIQAQIESVHEFYGETKLPIYVAESVRLGKSENNDFTILKHPYLGEFNDKLQDQFSYIPLNVSNLNPTNSDEPGANPSAEMYKQYFKKDNRVYLPAVNLLFYLGN